MTQTETPTSTTFKELLDLVDLGDSPTSRTSNELLDLVDVFDTTGVSEIIRRVHPLGAQLAVFGGKLHIRGSSKLPAALMGLIREHKLSIVADLLPDWWRGDAVLVALHPTSVFRGVIESVSDREVVVRVDGVDDPPLRLRFIPNSPSLVRGSDSPRPRPDS